MWIDATGGEDELGPIGAVGAGGEKCVADIIKADTGSEAGAGDMVMWGS